MADSETDAESESIWESVRNEVEAANKRKNTEFFNPNKRQNMLDASEKSDTDSEINVGKILQNLEEMRTSDDVELKQKQMDEDFHNHIQDVLGYKVIHIHGDGNCLFRAIGRHPHIKLDHLDVRHVVVTYIEDNKDCFSEFMEDDILIENHIENMKITGTWGGEVEVVAASKVFGVNISLFDPLSHRFYNGDPKRERRTLILSYHGGNHYNLLHDAGNRARVSMAKAKFERLSSDMVKDCYVTYEGDLVVLTRMQN